MLPNEGNPKTELRPVLSGGFRLCSAARREAREDGDFAAESGSTALMPCRGIAPRPAQESEGPLSEPSHGEALRLIIVRLRALGAEVAQHSSDVRERDRTIAVGVALPARLLVPSSKVREHRGAMKPLLDALRGGS